MTARILTPIHASDEALLPCAVDRVWKTLADIPAYPAWWPRSLRLRVLTSRPGLIGSEVEVRPVGGRSFRCRVESVEENRRLRMTYLGGFIAGWGEWQLEPEGAGTRVRYTLDVTAEGRLVAWVGRLVSLGKIHSRQMQGVLRQLERSCCRCS